jgi:CubicO group peptidase (beta-lactamase class C family)
LDISGYHLLEEIVARVSGQEYHDYVREHVFRAAGMGSADFYTLPQLREDRRIAHGYYRPEGSTDRIDIFPVARSKAASMCRTPSVRLQVARCRFGRPAARHAFPLRGGRFNGPNSSTQITRPSVGGWS